ncbi:protein ITPRID1 isoform X1 [Pleurodeles waltl]|uniref:protein ITPRID1 isoform X1 n=1 Tax=Pleurodeles waltl TaxID=8319 RepID=UPI003709A6DF
MLKSCSVENLLLKEDGAPLYKDEMEQLTVTDYMRTLQAMLESPSASTQGDSSEVVSVQPTSIPELMKHWEADPVELLLDLGFGKEEPDITTRIPSRFINSTSSSKGINIRVLLEAQKQRMSIENPNLYGRFRQLEVLDQVTSAFTSLCDTVQAKPDAEDPEETKLGKRRRVCQLLRKASRQQTLIQQDSVMGSGRQELLKEREEASPNAGKADRGKPPRKPKKRLTENCLALLAEEQVYSEDNADFSAPLVRAPNGSALLPAHASLKPSPLSVESSLKDRARKKSTFILTKTLKRASGLDDRPADSFEMEEIQSFEDETLRGSYLENTSEAEMMRTNSCQSDSSGFLEEPIELVTLKSSHLPESLNISSDSADSQSTLLSGLDSAYQDYKYELNGLINSTVTSDAEHFPKPPGLKHQDGAQGEAEHVMNVREQDWGNSQCYNLEIQRDVFNDDMVLADTQTKARTEIEELIGDIRKEFSPTWPFYGKDTAQLFYRVHTFQEKDPQLDECFEKESMGNIKQNVQENERPYSENSITADSGFLFLKPSLDSVVHEFHRSQEEDLPETPLRFSDTQQAKYNRSQGPLCSPNLSEDLTQTATTNIDCQETTDTNGYSNLRAITRAQVKDPNQTSEKTTNFYKSVTIQMSSDLISSLQNVPSGQFITRDYSYEFPRMASQNSEDERVPPLKAQAVEAPQTIERKESSSQTDIGEIGIRHSCLHLRRGTLSKSTSFDTGFLGRTLPPKANDPKFCTAKKCLSCHCCCCCHYHCSLCDCPLPLAPTCPKPCCSNYTSMEWELLRTLTALQDSIRNISPGTVSEMETMKKSCQTFREQLVETEQLLFEQQTLLPSDFTDEGREEMRRLQVLRRAVHREVTELEFQLDDRSRQMKEGILLQLNQLLEEQAKLHSELELTDLKKQVKDQNPGIPDNVLGATQYPQSIATECSLSVAQQDGMEKPVIPQKETKVPNQQKKGDFSTFLQNLRKSFKNSFGSENTE